MKRRLQREFAEDEAQREAIRAEQLAGLRLSLQREFEETNRFAIVQAEEQIRLERIYQNIDLGVLNQRRQRPDLLRGEIALQRASLELELERRRAFLADPVLSRRLTPAGRFQESVDIRILSGELSAIQVDFSRGLADATADGIRVGFEEGWDDALINFGRFFLQRLQRDVADALYRSCLLYTSPSPRD